MQSTFNPANPVSVTTTPWYRHRWPWLLMSGPAVVVVAGLFTVWLAVVRGDALVADDYYKQGNAINKDLRRDREAWRQGARVVLAYDSATGQLRGRLQLAHAPAGEQAHTLFLSLVHPTQPPKDRAVVIPVGADGSFSLAMPEPDQTRWRLVVEDGSRSWRLHGNWSWPQQQGASLDAGAYAPAE